MNSRSLRLPAISAVTFAASIVAAVVTFRAWPLQVSAVLVALALVAMMSEWLAFEFAALHFSITYAVCAAAIILLGPAAGAVVAGLSAVPPAFLEKDRPVWRGLFNTGQLTLASAAAGWAYVQSGGRIIAGHPLSSAEIPTVILPVALLALLTFAVNTTLISGAMALLNGAPFLHTWRSAFVWTIPGEAALTVLALALAQVVASEGAVGLLLFFVPLMIARQFYERYVTLRRAYADTVRSLVAVVEAKDAYTKGHSERVARLSVDAATRMGFNEQRLERLELAALLHDLGKVGVSRSIISKPSRLSEQEFEAIKGHPRIGAEIVRRVSFLADLVPYIEAHHERVDGSGYGSRLSGEQIPAEARILSVADAFDAMTSSRPYRPALSNEDACLELRRCAGKQFDPAVVQVFVQMLEEVERRSAPAGVEATVEAV